MSDTIEEKLSQHKIWIDACAVAAAVSRAADEAWMIAAESKNEPNDDDKRHARAMTIAARDARQKADDLKPALSQYAAALGRKGGASTSPAKRAASAANGKRGGRPRKAA